MRHVGGDLKLAIGHTNLVVSGGVSAGVIHPRHTSIEMIV